MKIPLIDTVKALIHDLRNIIFMLDSGLQLIKKSIEEGNSTKALDLLSKVSKQVDRAKVISSDTQEKKEAVSVCKVLRSLIEDFNIGFPVNIDTHQGEKWVAIKYTELYRILINIINNALEASEHTQYPSLECFVKSENNKVQIGFFNSGRHIKFKEIDGEMTVSYIFDKGFSTKGREGLGLYTVRTLVRANDGFIQVINKRAGGVQMIVTLPEYKHV